MNSDHKAAKLVAIAFILLGVSTAAQKPIRQFDLKGETLGESLEAFRKTHPAARCLKNDPALTVRMGKDGCAVHRGISFAGLPALVDEDCDQIEAKVGDGHNCWEGLSAQFRNGKLIQLIYTVEAEGGPEFALNQVLSALTEKFGKPEQTKTIWIRGNEVLILARSGLPIGQGKGKVSVITVILAVNENAMKDI